MKYAVAFIIFLLSACHGWEFPRLTDIQRVENEELVLRLTIGELEGQSQYINVVIEVEGVILHIVNKGGQPAISLGAINLSKKEGLGLLLAFGPKEKESIKKLKVGDIVIFKGILMRGPEYRKPGHINAAIVVKNPSKALKNGLKIIGA